MSGVVDARVWRGEGGGFAGVGGGFVGQGLSGSGGEAFETGFLGGALGGGWGGGMMVGGGDGAGE